MSQESVVSSGDANAPGSVYQDADAAATPQAGPIYEKDFDASGKVLSPVSGSAYPKGTVRAEFSVQPRNKPPVIILSVP